MRLYKNSEGVWAGTQADARKMCGKLYQTVDVPTDKPSLLRFLNAHKVGNGGLKSDIGSELVDGWFDKTKDRQVTDESLSYFRWGYDKLFLGQYDEGKALIKRALELTIDRTTTSDG